MKKLKYIILSLTVLLVLYGCKKDLQTDFKDFYKGHDIVYTGQVGKVTTQPGNLQMGLKWKTGIDPSITGYVIYYNNGADSQVVNVTTHTDSVYTTIKGLSEYTYAFTIYSFDAQGNKSVPTIVNNAKVYGPIFSAGLVNRGYKEGNPYTMNDDGTVFLNFVKADTIIINTKTILNYTSTAGASKTATLLAKDSVITLDDYKPGTAITYKSYYLPEKTAIDVFEVAAASTFPAIVDQNSLCDKSLFKVKELPNDIPGSPGQAIEHLWDGSVGPQAPPNVYFSDGSKTTHDNPNHFTIDLGKVYNNLSRIEETGTVVSPLNPIEFEVWGIADVTNAATNSPADNPGWVPESKGRGWTLLKTCTRTDDGTAAMKFELDSNPPPVRYIRIRILKSALAPNVFGISELTFWNKKK